MSKDICSEIIDNLLKIGFSQYEAKVYIASVANPKSTAYELSKLSGVPQSKIYETMKKLLKKGLVTIDGIKPVKYTVLPTEEFLNKYKSDVDNSISFLKKNINLISKKTSLDYICHFSGEFEINFKLKELIKNSKKNIYLSIWAEDYNNLHEELLEAHKRGIKIVSVLYEKPDFEVGKVYYHEMEGMQEDAALHGKWLSIVIDESKTLFSIKNGSDNICFLTENKALMLTSECFITHDILLAEIYSKFKDQLDKEFGNNMINIRKNFDIG